jgi:hypothetical protein
MASSWRFADDGRPSFNALQNYGSAGTPILYFVFDVLALEGRDLTERHSTAGEKSSKDRSCRLSPSRYGMPPHWTRACET